MSRERGWLIPYLMHGDPIFGAGRLAWWMSVEINGILPEEPIPHIDFRTANANDISDRGFLRSMNDAFGMKMSCNGKCPPRSFSPAGALAHINDLVLMLGGGWSSMSYIVRWLAWGLGVGAQSEEPAEPQPGWEQMLHGCFELGRLQAADTDVFGAVISDSIGKGSKWNRNAFYPTPQEVCEMMVQMTMSDKKEVHKGKDTRLLSVMDPCVGTGRMLLSASNHSVKLFGCDIDPMMVDCCAINMALYAPWVVYQTPRQKAVMRTLRTDNEAMAVNMADLREVEGHSKIEKPREYDAHGQGMLFSFGKEQDLKCRL